MPTETNPLEARLAELERFCGQLALENAVLKKALQNLQHEQTSAAISGNSSGSATL
jgi:transcription initiation factor TFIIIB Brf1 subunit/transcription initiation factor TFIIB